MVGWDLYDDVASQADFVVCSLPLTSQTRGILDRKRFSAMKKGARFINVGRGDTVVEGDLYEALASGHLGGASLDVWFKYNWNDENPPPYFPSNYPFHELPQVLMSPHRAANYGDAELIGGAVYWETPIYNINAVAHNIAPEGSASPIPLRSVVELDKGY